MRTRFLLLAFARVCLSFIPPPYQYRVEYYDMDLDHFSFDSDYKFNMKYLINDSFWDPDGGPIFFYTGNEGNIETFADNTGFMWDIAPEFKAMLVFAEHRYYGSSFPHENTSQIARGKLSTEQALADYAVFLTWLKGNTTGAAKSPVIAFGGSYGGMLAAWMRMKYPHVVIGSIAASAPLGMPEMPCSTFSDDVTGVYRDAAPDCEKLIKRSWTVLRNKAVTESGLAWINVNFHLCNDSFLQSEQDISNLTNWLAEAWGLMAMVNYPYPTSFMGDVSGWPVKEACNRIVESTKANDSDDNLLIGISNGVSVYHNSSGRTKCFSINQGSINGPDLWSWVFQLCTELVYLPCSPESSLFEPYTQTLEGMSVFCKSTFGVSPRPTWLLAEYGTLLNFTSNIVFSNGVLDPWYGYGILQSVSDSVVAVVIKDAAHHYDLRGEHPLDTDFVKEARQQEKQHISRWIDEWQLIANPDEKVNSRNHRNTVAKVVERGKNFASRGIYGPACYLMSSMVAIVILILFGWH